MTNSNIGRFVWYDLLTSDPDAAIGFYSHVLGWKTQPFENGYTMFVSEQGPLGGVVKLKDDMVKMGAPPHWTSNVQVADVDATAKQAKKLGGKVFVEPFDFSNVGRLAVLVDAQGAPINVFRPNEPMKLRDTTRVGEFCWNELVTSEHEGAFRYYATLFGWKRKGDHDMGAMGKYLLYGTDAKDLGGMFTKAQGMPVPAMWCYYVQVADLDAAILRAKSKGGKLLNGPMEVPGGARIAQLTDPQGAAFALHEVPKTS